jgi:outer membrane protein TolC
LAYCNLTGSDRASPIPVFPKEIPAIKHDISALLQSMSSTPTFEDPVSLLNADDSIHAERLSYEITSTRLRPKLGLSLNASQGYNTPNNAELYGAPYVLTSYGASITVNWSIFDGYSTQAAKQSSLIRLRQLRNSRDQTERDFKENLKSYVANLRFNWESLQTAELNFSGYRSTADLYKADYEAGLAPKKTWDDAKIVADNALQGVNNVRADYYMQIVNYLSLRGKDPAVNPATDKKTFDAAKN